MKKGFMPYENEIDSQKVGDDLIIENRLDKISIYGSVELTKDKEGLQYAYALKRVIDATIEALKYKDLPDHIQIAETDMVTNPFN